MQNQSPFTIYNASAGSGKTFTLVKDYLKILFQSKSKLAFRNILALTFTNKAVSEMKERVINMLKLFSEENILESPNSMSKVLVEELNIDLQELHNRSKIVLQRIVHNYAAFDISTIDKFNHKLIRTFAYDLKLPINFEVELDAATLLGKAVDKLIDKAGSDQALTKVLVDFAFEKMDDDKSWDISYDLNAIAPLLVNENEIPYLDKLKDKSLDDFKALKTKLQKQKTEVEHQIINLAQATLNLIESNGLDVEDFTRKTLPNHFKKAQSLNFYGLYSNKLQDNLASNTSIYNKTLDAEKAMSIDRLLPEIETNYLTIKRLVYTSKFLKNALKNITPLSVLSAIGKTLQEIKNEDDLLLISEFNNLINNEIKEQPAPFIYERIGEKFKHYFIDEFQDTSGLQWNNLIPLVNNAVSGENLKGETGTAMLVGDAKQAIYRWRGGRAEQFIDLYSEKEKPLATNQDVRDLTFNYRSHKTIVEFNNAFFDHISNFAFSDADHEFIYKNAQQDVFLEATGYVELSFLDTKEEDKNELHCEAVLNTIKKVERQGFKRKDICIIVRKTKEGIAIAEYLSDLDIDIISSETLLLKNAPEVQFINHLITLSLQAQNDEIKIKLLNFIVEEKLESINKHGFFSRLIHLKPMALFDALNGFGFQFNYSEFLQLPIYEAVESIIRGFHLNETSNAYIQFYLDEVFDYSQKYNTSFSGFLDYWDRKKDKLSIVSPESDNAIQIMTIHKSKGLEFPVVIFPYANQDIYFDMSPKVWFPVDKTLFEGFSNLYINLNKDLEEFNDLGAQIYSDYRAQLELDSLNLLYVVLTRAIGQLYIISEYDVDKSQIEKLTHYSGLFINYLKTIGKWNEQQMQYTFGEAKKFLEAQETNLDTIEQRQFISTKKEELNLNIITNSGYLWDTAQEQAIERGNLVHQIMALIKTKHDVDFAIDHFLSSGFINSEQSKTLKDIIHNLVNHKDLKTLFKDHLRVYNEKDIISKKGKLLRPDRVVINSKKQAVIVDYKTGLQDSSHKEQLYDYQYVLEEMDFEVIKKILIYINDDITIKEF
ncbi:exodeoxyribonuclease V subunit beta [uncultured Psychroserpens sp.]|uniref:UvrD-helicase domain-containing protein n=1 Tax=uncultured Psychroserpens sp. TaxID=255436 RepID=UPI002618B04F|nr:UvrD-helicase domain-containing protein [uncultured Psychroserpens sp.]